MSYAHGKKKYKTVKVHYVAILDCLAETGVMKVDTFNISPALPDEVILVGDESCAGALAALLNGGFKPLTNAGIAAGFGTDPRSRYTLIKTKKMRVPVESTEKAEGDDNDN